MCLFILFVSLILKRSSVLERTVGRWNVKTHRSRFSLSYDDVTVAVPTSNVVVVTAVLMDPVLNEISTFFRAKRVDDGELERLLTGFSNRTIMRSHIRERTARNDEAQQNFYRFLSRR